MSYILQALKKSEQERILVAENLALAGGEVVDNPSPKLSSSPKLKTQSEINPAVKKVNWGYATLAVLITVSAYLLVMVAVPEPSRLANQEALIKIEEKPPLTEPAIIEAVAVEQAPEAIVSLLPMIDISSHIYSSLPKRRSIVVNGARLMEGEFIAANVQIKQITHQGMVVDVQGWSLIIGRSRGWSR